MKRRARKRLRVVIGAGVAAAILACVVLGRGDRAPASPDDAIISAPRASDAAGDVPALPAAARPARPWHVVRAAYDFAARRPDVLQYVPCFCGCERHGHRSNHDCFVAGRDGERVLKWDAHGVT